MNRRAFVTGLAAVLAAPLEIQAQRERLYKVGYLGLSAGPTSTTRAFREELRERGWMEGQNISIEYRWLARSVEGPAALAQRETRRSRRFGRQQRACRSSWPGRMIL